MESGPFSRPRALESGLCGRLAAGEGIQIARPGLDPKLGGHGFRSAVGDGKKATHNGGDPGNFFRLCALDREALRKWALCGFSLGWWMDWCV